MIPSLPQKRSAHPQKIKVPAEPGAIRFLRKAGPRLAWALFRSAQPPKASPKPAA